MHVRTDGEREEGREACGSTQDRNYGRAEGCCMAGAVSAHQIIHALPPMSQPCHAVKLGQCDQLADGMWAEGIDAASRFGTEALERLSSSFLLCLAELGAMC